MNENPDQKLIDQWNEKKTALLVDLLGPEHDTVMHALIPYAVGGSLDLYYFPNGIPGTAVATREVCEVPGEGSSNEVFENYELVMFTRHPIALDKAHDETTPFGRVHQSINAILNCIAPYSAQATLNPHETCEFPSTMARIGGKCLIFDAYRTGAEKRELGLLALIEIHRSEMEFARNNGGEKLILMLKQAGYYPYSDMDRPAIA